jgi:hypothetical protein
LTGKGISKVPEVSVTRSPQFFTGFDIHSWQSWKITINGIPANAGLKTWVSAHGYTGSYTAVSGGNAIGYGEIWRGGNLGPSYAQRYRKLG